MGWNNPEAPKREQLKDEVNGNIRKVYDGLSDNDKKYVEKIVDNLITSEDFDISATENKLSVEKGHTENAELAESDRENAEKLDPEKKLRELFGTIQGVDEIRGSQTFDGYICHMLKDLI